MQDFQKGVVVHGEVRQANIMHAAGGKGVTPSNILKKLFLCLDTCKSTKEWYQVECEKSKASVQTCMSKKFLFILHTAQKLGINNAFEMP